MKWILTAQESKLPEFRECWTAFLNWFPYILNSLDVSNTNSFTKDTNKKQFLFTLIYFSPNIWH